MKGSWPQVQRRNTVFSRLVSGLCLLLGSLLGLFAGMAQTNVVTVCDEASLRAAVNAGGTVQFGCDGTIYLTSTLEIGTNTFLDAAGHAVTISGSNAVQVFRVATSVNFTLRGLTVAEGLASGANRSGGRDSQ